ncbi:MAG: hypothetical protein ACPHID_04560 [Thermoplasmatota archaeon]
MEDATISALYRFLHVLAGITWIGLLYFFNLVNAPAIKFPMKKPVDVDMSAAAGRDLALKTLWWFRWGAAMTVLFGLLLMDAVAQSYGGWDVYMGSTAGKTIAVGAGLGLIMAFNVWFIIWPNQQVVQSNNHKIEHGAENVDELKADNATRLPKIKMASRFNFWASIPMLFFMIFAAHGGEALAGLFGA